MKQLLSDATYWQGISAVLVLVVIWAVLGLRAWRKAYIAVVDDYDRLVRQVPYAEVSCAPPAGDRRGRAARAWADGVAAGRAPAAEQITTEKEEG